MNSRAYGCQCMNDLVGYSPDVDNRSMSWSYLDRQCSFDEIHH